MKNKAAFAGFIGAVIVISTLVYLEFPGSSSASPLLVHEQSIELPGAEGRIDHLDYDPLHERLFVAELGNNSVAVVNLSSNSIERVLTGFSEPQGVLYVPRFDELFVSNGGTGAVDVYNATTFTQASVIKLTSDADNMRLDPGTEEVYVGFGQGNKSGIAVINCTLNSVVRVVPLAGHPESFQIEQNGSRVFVNIPFTASVLVFNKTTGATLGNWPLPGYVDNFPMALDEQGHRLLVGTWYPPKVVVYDTNTGKLVANLTISEEADDIAYEKSFHLFYVSCTAGYIDVVRQLSPGQFSNVLTYRTSAGARTSALILNPPRLVLAVPGAAGASAELQLFALGV